MTLGRWSPWAPRKDGNQKQIANNQIAEFNNRKFMFTRLSVFNHVGPAIGD